MGQGLRVLIREKACGEEIDAILASSQPPLVTTLSSFAALEKSQRENLANYLAKLAWPLLTRNLPMYCYNYCEQCRFALTVSAPEASSYHPQKLDTPHASSPWKSIASVYSLLALSSLGSRAGPQVSHPLLDASRSMLAAALGLFIFGSDSR